MLRIQDQSTGGYPPRWWEHECAGYQRPTHQEMHFKVNSELVQSALIITQNGKEITWSKLSSMKNWRAMLREVSRHRVVAVACSLSTKVQCLEKARKVILRFGNTVSRSIGCPHENFERFRHFVYRGTSLQHSRWSVVLDSSKLQCCRHRGTSIFHCQKGFEVFPSRGDMKIHEAFNDVFDVLGLTKIRRREVPHLSITFIEVDMTAHQLGAHPRFIGGWKCHIMEYVGKGEEVPDYFNGAV